MKYLHFELVYCIFRPLLKNRRCFTKKYPPSKPFVITGKKKLMNDFSHILISLSRAQPPTPSRISKSDIRTLQQVATVSWKFKQANPCCRHSNSLGKLTQNHTNNIAKVHHKILCMLQQRQSVVQGFYIFSFQSEPPLLQLVWRHFQDPRINLLLGSTLAHHVCNEFSEFVQCIQLIFQASLQEMFQPLLI